MVYAGNPVLRYLAVLKAARDFGVPQNEIELVAGRFDPRTPRCEELADAFADLILAREPLATRTAGSGPTA
jgi:hypothetical protein